MGRDPEELRAELEALTPTRKKKSSLESRVAEAWDQSTHVRWDRLTPQWQTYILNTVKALEEQ